MRAGIDNVVEAAIYLHDKDPGLSLDEITGIIIKAIKCESTEGAEEDGV